MSIKTTEIVFKLLITVLVGSTLYCSNSNLRTISSNYPSVDGLTSTHPLSVLIACKVFGISYEWRMPPSSERTVFPSHRHNSVFENNAFQGYVIRSPGRDGKFEFTDPTIYKDGPVEGFERDIVFSIGSMSQWPEGFMPP